MKDVYLQLWEAFNDIYFEEVPHKYMDSYGTDYTSVTTFIGQLEEQKDWDLIAEKAINKPGSKYAGMTVEQVRAQWKQAGAASCVLGTAVHSVLELGWQNKEFSPDYSLFEPYPGMREDFEYRKKKCKAVLKILRERYVPIRNETIVYDRDWRLCGTIDMLGYNKMTKQYAILDWKTNKKWDFTNKFQRLKKPFDMLDDCNVNHYELQLNTYKAILEKHTDIKIGEMLLVQIPNQEKGLVETHICRDHQSVLIPYLDEYRKK